MTKWDSFLSSLDSNLFVGFLWSRCFTTFCFDFPFFAKNFSTVFPPSFQFALKMTFNYSVSTVCWFEMRFHNLRIVFSSQSDKLPMRKMSFSTVDKTFPSLIHLLSLLSLNVFTKKSLKSSQSVFNILIFFKKWAISIRKLCFIYLSTKIISCWYSRYRRSL